MLQREIKVKDYKYFVDLRKNGIGKKRDLVQGIVPRKSLILNYGGPKCGKSIFELAKCMSLSRGIKFLGKYKTTKTPCLYIDLENPEDIIDERELALKKFLKKRKHYVNFITRDSPVDILNKEFVDELKKIVREKSIGYIVIDTLPKAANYKPIEEQEVNKLFISFFQPLIDEFNLSITFLLHTTKKGDSFIGSQAYKGIVDCCFEFRKSYDKENIVKTEIHSDNRGMNISFGVQFIFYLIYDKEGYSHLKEIDITHYEIEERRAGEKTHSKPSKINSQISKDIISLFKTDSKFKKSDIIKGLSDQGYDSKRLLELDSTIKRILAWLSNQEILTLVGKGKATYYELKKKEVLEIKNLAEF